ncbi:putative efflux protein, MATE family [Caldanaerovirga acetigignens]|uniref:Probable multidrug resistance protein NorM n=1 Tax=Caldanaerovirga acetigignens TaxID=447595 RepID=A0A1M7K8T8_9FIRM|nr:MATE family efflux transporter [Caldanaerovirga acetigignens]SHM61393.1 putative efflux protein, MATE family [Caldanaerovirga acetigignens]
MKEVRQAVKTFSLRKKIMRLSLPAIFEMISGTIVWVADTAMIGRLSAEALNAVGLGGQLAFNVTYIFGTLGDGVLAMVSRYIGGGDKKRANYVSEQALIMSACLGIILTIIYFFGAEWIFGLLTDDPEVIVIGTKYMKILAFAVTFMVPTYVVNCALRGAGNAVVPMLSAAIGNFLNIVGDYAFIFGNFGFPRMEVEGAALATTISQIVAAVITLGYAGSGRAYVTINFNKLAFLDLKLMRGLFSLSLPSFLEELSFGASRMLSSIWINRLGTMAFAAHQVAVTGESLSFMPGYGFSVAASAIVGQSLGAKEEKVAEKAAWEAARLSAILMGMTAVLFFLVPEKITGVFTNIPEVRVLAARCLKIGALEQVSIAYSMTLAGALRGAGDTRGPFQVTLISLWLVRIPLIFLVIFVFKASLEFVWVTTVLQFFIEAVLMGRRFKKGEWKKITI